MTNDSDPGAQPPTGEARTSSRLLDVEQVAEEIGDVFRDRVDVTITRIIAHHGWALIPVPGPDDLPDLVHTVGLHSYGEHPELVVIGLKRDAAARLLDTLAAQVRDGHRFDGEEPPALAVPGWKRLGLRAISPAASTGLLEFANRRYQSIDGPPVRALQVVWSDATGALPTDDEWTLPSLVQPLAHDLGPCSCGMDLPRVFVGLIVPDDFEGDGPDDDGEEPLAASAV